MSLPLREPLSPPPDKWSGNGYDLPHSEPVQPEPRQLGPSHFSTETPIAWGDPGYLDTESTHEGLPVGSRYRQGNGAKPASLPAKPSRSSKFASIFHFFSGFKKKRRAEEGERPLSPELVFRFTEPKLTESKEIIRKANVLEFNSPQASISAQSRLRVYERDLGVGDGANRWP